MNNNSWYKATLDIDSETDTKLQRVLYLAQRDDEFANRPEGFALFRGVGLHKNGRNATWIIYISPVAASFSKSLVNEFNAEQCDRPDRNETGLEVLYAGLKSSPPWKLLTE